jgi:triphosphoribosyl-dephospho-CoA synthetase
MDEVHFQQHGSRCRMWVAPETQDPVLLHPPTRKSVGYYGAVRLRDGRFIFRRQTGKFNALTCWEFLQELCASSTRRARQVVVITDNARFGFCVHNRYFTSLSDVALAVETEFENWTKPNHTLRRLFALT